MSTINLKWNLANGNRTAPSFAVRTPQWPQKRLVKCIPMRTAVINSPCRLSTITQEEFFPPPPPPPTGTWTPAIHSGPGRPEREVVQPIRWATFSVVKAARAEFQADKLWRRSQLKKKEKKIVLLRFKYNFLFHFDCPVWLLNVTHVLTPLSCQYRTNHPLSVRHL